MDTKTIKESISPPTSQLNTGISSPPCVSSEDGFDFVSSSNVSADETPRKVKDEDEGGDSDWE